MRLLQDKIPVIVQSTQPKQWTKQVLQPSITNRHVVHNTASHGYALHSISPTITTSKKVLTFVTPSLYGNINEPYGRVVHPAHDDTSKSNQDDSHLDSTNAPQVAASSSGGGGGDDEEDPYKKKPNDDGCGGDESPVDRNENDQGDEEENDNENAFRDEAVDVVGSDNPDDFLNITFDGDMDIVLDEEDDEDDEDMGEHWQK